MGPISCLSLTALFVDRQPPLASKIVFFLFVNKHKQLFGDFKCHLGSVAWRLPPSPPAVGAVETAVRVTGIACNAPGTHNLLRLPDGN